MSKNPNFAENLWGKSYRGEGRLAWDKLGSEGECRWGGVVWCGVVNGEWSDMYGVMWCDVVRIVYVVCVVRVTRVVDRTILSALCGCPKILSENQNEVRTSA